MVIFILAVIIYRPLAAIWLFNDSHTRKFAPLLASTSGAMVNISVVCLVSHVIPFRST